MKATFLPKIAAAMVARDAALAEFNRILAEAQAACAHTEVLEAPWSRSSQAQRVCRLCGFHERGGYGSETTGNIGPWLATTARLDSWSGRIEETRLTTEFAKPVMADAISQYILKASRHDT